MVLHAQHDAVGRASVGQAKSRHGPECFAVLFRYDAHDLGKQRPFSASSQAGMILNASWTQTAAQLAFNTVASSFFKRPSSALRPACAACKSQPQILRCTALVNMCSTTPLASA